MSKNRNKPNFGTALTLEELKTYEGSIVRVRQTRSVRFSRVNPDIHYHTGIQCEGCFKLWLYEQHGPFSGSIYHKIDGLCEFDGYQP